VDYPINTTDKILATHDTFLLQRHDKERQQDKITLWGNGANSTISSFVTCGFCNISLSSGVLANAALYQDPISRKTNLIAWGNPNTGGVIPDNIKNLNFYYGDKIAATSLAFAIRTVEDKAVAWGHPSVGGDTTSVQSQLTNIKEIFSNSDAFAAVKYDGTVVTWGDPSHGGDSSKVKNKLVFVKKVVGTEQAFAALTDYGTVITWGDPAQGGDSSAVQSELTNIKEIYSTTGGAFAALKNDGTVVAWGNSDSGGDTYDWLAEEDLKPKLNNIYKIFSSHFYFAALKNDGTVVTWGNYFLIHSWEVESQFKNIVDVIPGITDIAGNKEDGSVVSVGDFGMRFSSVQPELKNVIKIIANEDKFHNKWTAFAALKTDGTVVTWGVNAAVEFNSSSVQPQLHNIVNIYATEGAFAALRNDGAVITWGNQSMGGE
jgi:alpha-tubulin suppressor-like RCC1 family protein